MNFAISSSNFSDCKTSGFAKITLAPFFNFSKFSCRCSFVCCPLKTTISIFPSSIRRCWSLIKARSGYKIRVGPSIKSEGTKKQSDFPAPVGSNTICFPRSFPSWS